MGFLVDTTMAALRLIFAGLYERHHEFKLYLCHAGSLLPQLAGRIDYEGGRFPGGTGKLEAPPSERIKQLHTDTVCAWPPALELVGPKRRMFGTDYPFWQAPASSEALAGAGLPAETVSGIESSNAERVFGLAG